MTSLNHEMFQVALFKTFQIFQKQKSCGNCIAQALSINF